MIFGQQHVFAIEAKFDRYVDVWSYGYIQVFVNGITFGDFQQSVSLNICRNYLMKLRKQFINADFGHFEGLSSSDLFEEVYERVFSEKWTPGDRRGTLRKYRDICHLDSIFGESFEDRYGGIAVPMNPNIWIVCRNFCSGIESVESTIMPLHQYYLVLEEYERWLTVVVERNLGSGLIRGA